MYILTRAHTHESRHRHTRTQIQTHRHTHTHRQTHRQTHTQPHTHTHTQSQRRPIKFSRAVHINMCPCSTAATTTHLNSVDNIRWVHKESTNLATDSLAGQVAHHHIRTPNHSTLQPDHFCHSAFR